MKTEKEKMLSGEIYDFTDTELITRWHKAKQLQKEYAAASDVYKRQQIQQIRRNWILFWMNYLVHMERMCGSLLLSLWIMVRIFI